jgi:hypothetical protein
MGIPTLTYPPTSGQTVNTLPPGGQALMASSLPVTLASDQPAIPVSGTVTASISGTVPISGTFWQATQPVSASSLPLPAGAATDATLGQIKAALGSPLQSGGAVSVSNLPPTPAGTNSIGGVNVDNVADSLVTAGSATGVATVVFAPTKGFQGGSFQIISAGTGNTVTFEQSNDSTDGANGTWASLYVANSGGAGGTTTSNPVVIAGASYKFESTCAMVRARVSTYGSGTVTITLCQKRLCAPVSLLSLSSGTNTIGNVNVTVGYTDSAAALASAATYTGTGRAISGAPFAAYFNATAYADQAGTLSVWQSTDSGATYYQMQTLAIAAGTSGTIQAKVTGANSAATLYQVRYTNGATAQGVFRLASSFTAG